MKKICKNCGEFKEHEAFGLCKKCYMKEWRRKNPEKMRLAMKRWALNNSEKKKEIWRKWKRENPEYYKNYALENKEKYKLNAKKLRNKKLKYMKKYNEGRKEILKEYYKKNSDRIKARVKIYSKKYRQSFAGKLCIRRDNLKRRVNGTIKKGIISQIINDNILHYGVITCEKCKRKCETKFHVDHIIPISKGGSNDYDNLQILCAKCNLEKHIKIADYRQDIENNQLYLRGGFSR